MGRTKGSKNRPKDQATLQLSQVSTRTRRSHDATPEYSDSDSEDEGSSLLEFKSSLQKSFKRLEREMARIHEELSNLEKNFDKAIEFLTQRVEEVEMREKRNAEKIKSLEEEIKNLRKADAEHNEKINVQERFSRRNNIRIVGFPTTENENCVEIAKSVMEKAGVPNVKVERAHRDGRENRERPRHILVKLSFYADKITALKQQRRLLAQEAFFITDDLTKADLLEKRKFAQQVAQLYREGTKLRFSAGKWRDSEGKPFVFQEVTTS